MTDRMNVPRCGGAGVSGDLVSRLLEQHGKMDGYGGGPRLRNPDGPEAVAYIADLENDLSEGSFYKERDIDAFQARIAALEAERDKLRAALDRAKYVFFNSGGRFLSSGRATAEYDLINTALAETGEPERVEVKALPAKKAGRHGLV